jgi:phosphoribosyl-ATP pyrophosphohydrolase/phosphoribosyl-AMP cyclohydrolase/histidinol dehydrogenase
LVKAAGGDASTVAIILGNTASFAVGALGTCVLEAKRVAQLHAFGVHVVGVPVAALPEARGAGAAAPTDTEGVVGSQLDVAHCFALCARSDRPDDLIPTVVTDEYERALGLVYSSRPSLVIAIQEGRGVYYSRSRAALWRKGDTSGMWQALLSARLDCDSDAVLFRVQQHGEPPAFCHKFTRSCWGDSAGIPGLERTLWSRKANAPPGSYTKRLFDDRALLRHKLLEEVQEQHEALQSGDKDHLAAETADVLYFAMVAAAAGGVKLSDVEAHLDRRALYIKRRKGDAKAARIEAAEAALAQGTAADSDAAK